VEGMAFPPNHPYMQAAPLNDKQLLSWTDANYQNYPEQRPNRNGKVYETNLHYKPTKSRKEQARKEKDWQNRLKAADAIAHYFDTELFIPPTFRTNRDWRYSYFYDRILIPGKMPDLKFNIEWWELESYEGEFNIKTRVKKMLKAGKDQLDKIIIFMNHDYDITRIKQQAMGYVNKNPTIKQIMLLDAKGNLHRLL